MCSLFLKLKSQADDQRREGNQTKQSHLPIEHQSNDDSNENALAYNFNFIRFS